MAEQGNPEKENQPGLYRKKEPPIDVSNASVGDFEKLQEVSKRSGIEFPYDGDKNAVTPERFVIIPKKRK
jgi:hypothetical protein